MFNMKPFSSRFFFTNFALYVVCVFVFTIILIKNSPLALKQILWLFYDYNVYIYLFALMRFHWSEIRDCNIKKKIIIIFSRIDWQSMYWVGAGARSLPTFYYFRMSCRNIISGQWVPELFCGRAFCKCRNNNVDSKCAMMMMRFFIYLI
jgi:hypothetical protein